MKQTIFSVSAALALAACSQEAAAPSGGPSGEADASMVARPAQADASDVPTQTPADPLVLAPDGLGDIMIGKAPPATLKRDDVQISDGCQTYTDKTRRIYAMTDGKVVARITAMKRSPVPTDRGIVVSASEAQVRAAYPDAAGTPHKYADAPAKYLDWRPGGGKSGLRFEIDGEGKVGMIHAGREPEIEYVEGCA